MPYCWYIRIAVLTEPYPCSLRKATRKREWSSTVSILKELPLPVLRECLKAHLKGLNTSSAAIRLPMQILCGWFFLGFLLFRTGEILELPLQSAAWACPYRRTLFLLRLHSFWMRAGSPGCILRALKPLLPWYFQVGAYRKLESTPIRIRRRNPFLSIVRLSYCYNLGDIIPESKEQ